MNEQERIAKIADLNDLCRKAMGVGNNMLVQTCGISALSMADQSAIREKVETFDAFDAGNNPWGERDFGTVRHNGMEIMNELPTLTDEELIETRIALRRNIALYNKWARGGDTNHQTREALAYAVYQKFGGDWTLDEIRQKDATLIW